MINVGINRSGKRSTILVNEIHKKYLSNTLKVEDLIESEEAMTTVKNNSEISKFFLKKENVIKLIDYATSEPIEDTLNIGHKYPFNAHELLSNNVVNIIKTFFGENIQNNTKDNDNNSNKAEENETQDQTEKEDNTLQTDEEAEKLKEVKSKENKENKYEILDYFFAFLKQKTELNYVLAGYFARIFGNLLNLRQNSLLYYIFSHKEVLDSLCSHLYRKSICECVYKILISKDNNTQFKQKADLIIQILKAPDYNNDDLFWNISDMLYDLICLKSFFSKASSSKELCSAITDFINKTFSYDIKDIVFKERIINYALKPILKVNEVLKRELTFGKNIVSSTKLGITATSNFTLETEEMFYNLLLNSHSLSTGDMESSFPTGIPESGLISEEKLGYKMKHETKPKLENWLIVQSSLLESVINSICEFADNMESSEGIWFQNTLMNQQKKLGLLRVSQAEYIRSIFELLSLIHENTEEEINEVEKIEHVLMKKNIIKPILVSRDSIIFILY